jgi:hypothetical protein
VGHFSEIDGSIMTCELMITSSHAIEIRSTDIVDYSLKSNEHLGVLNSIIRVQLGYREVLVEGWWFWFRVE